MRRDAMRYNGLQLVIRLALEKLGAPELNRYQDALILGAIREDIVYLPQKRKIWEHWSLSHFSGRYLGGGFIPFVTPGAAQKAQMYFDRALADWHARKTASAFIQLGRASHLLIDMACPVHASRVAHMTDGYEWYVEANCARLRELPFEVPSHYKTPRAAVAGLARFTQEFRPDRSNHHWGRLLKSLGLRKSVSRAEFSEQAACIIPVAAGHLAAVYLQFLEATRAKSSQAPNL